MTAARPRVLLLGGDGYAGWPLALHLSSHGFPVYVADNGAARETPSLVPIRSMEERVQAWTTRNLGSSPIMTLWNVDLQDGEAVRELLRRTKPDAIIHLAAAAAFNGAAAVLLNVVAAAAIIGEPCHLLLVKFAGGTALEHQLLSAVGTSVAAMRAGQALRVSELSVGALWGLQTAETRGEPALWNRYSPRTPQDQAVHALLQLPATALAEHLATASELRFECLHLEEFVVLVRQTLRHAEAADSVAYAAWHHTCPRLDEALAADGKLTDVQHDLGEVRRSAAATQRASPRLPPGALRVAVCCGRTDPWTQRLETTWVTARSQRGRGDDEAALDVIFIDDGDAVELRRLLGQSTRHAAWRDLDVDICHVLLRRKKAAPWRTVLRAISLGLPVVVTALEPLAFGTGPWLCRLLCQELPLEEHTRSPAQLAWRAAPAPLDFTTTREPAEAARQRLPNWRALMPELAGRRFVVLLWGEPTAALLATLQRSEVLREGALVLTEAAHHGEVCYVSRTASVPMLCYREPAGGVSPELLQGVDVVLYANGPLEAPAAALMMGIPVVWQLSAHAGGTPLWAFDANSTRFLQEACSLEELETALLDAIALPRGGRLEDRRRDVPTPAEALAELRHGYRRTRVAYRVQQQQLGHLLWSAAWVCLVAVCLVGLGRERAELAFAAPPLLV